MRYFPNIEKSSFMRGEYVGYADGAWRIRKSAFGGWEAHKFLSGTRKLDVCVRHLAGNTLEMLSERLTEYSNKTAKHYVPNEK